MNQNTVLSDYDLFLLLQREDENALSFVYDKYSPGLYGLILRQVQNVKLATEILQKTFLNIWNECKKIDNLKQRLFTWILSLAYKTANADYQINLSFSSVTPVNTDVYLIKNIKQYSYLSSISNSF